MLEAGSITQLLEQLREGDERAESRLMQAVYPELRRIAARHLRGERPGHTLQPTALVHEVYLRLFGPSEINWEDRAHFFRLAASVMRHILVDRARNRKAEKRGGAAIRITLDEFFAASERMNDLVLQVDRALSRLSKLDPRQARIVEMRFFGGLSEEEIASVLDLSSRTIKREWAIAKAWLRAELGH